MSTAFGVLGLLVGTATTVARSLPEVPGVSGDTWAMVTSFTDYGVLAYAVALMGLVTATLLRFRALRLVALAASVALAAVHLSWIVPSFVADGAPATSTGRLRVYSQNMLYGGADPGQVLAAAQQADVLVVVEMTQPAADAFTDHGIDSVFAYQAGGRLPWGGATGTRVYSRFPVVDSRPLDRSGGDHNWLVTVDVPDLGLMTVAAVHPTRPVRGGSDWAAEQELVRQRVPHERTLIAGDFNAVDSHLSLRRLRADGFSGANNVVGAGWQPTYPAEGLIPPLIAIDHILLSRDLTATAFRTVGVDGSDHRGVLATVAVRG